MVDEFEIPELYDLRFGSGVVREEDGVSIFRGITGGEGSSGVSACGVGGVNGSGGGFGIMDILFSLRASVGLIVRAPRPVACALPGMIETLLLLDEGVFDNGKLGLAGDLPALPGVEGGCSGVPVGVKNCSCTSILLGGGCIDLVLLYRLDWILRPS